MNIPRIALLTWCTADSRLAGGQAIRRVLCSFPREKARWAAFGESVIKDPRIPEYRAFFPRDLHWRLVGTTPGYFFINEVQAARTARRIWRWLEPFDPQVLWVVPELSAVYVGYHLARIGNLPLHATLHDSPEFSTHEYVPRLYYPLYRRSMRRLLGAAASFDCVTEELAEHVRSNYPLRGDCRSLVMPPLIDPALVSPVRDGDLLAGSERRIGLCGTFRMGTDQWQRFLDVLGSLPYEIEFVSLTPEDDVPPAPTPHNVSFRFLPYAEGDAQVLQGFRDARVDACYVGVWTDPRKEIFGRTSLSSKLVTYSATSTPIIVDAAEDTAAWRLVREQGAGIRLTGHSAVDRDSLEELFGNVAAWSRMAQGARAMALGAFDLDRNTQRFKELLCQTAAR